MDKAVKINKRKNKIREDVVFNNVAIVILSIFALSCLLPMIMVVSQSFSHYSQNQNIVLFPRGLTLYNYKQVVADFDFFRAVGMSLMVSVCGVILSCLVIAFAAYPLAKRDFPARRGIMLFFIVAMLFSGGMIPSFLVIKMLGLIDTPFVLILPGLANVYNLILMKNYFEGISPELEEAAKIDGANYTRILINIIMPISMPMLATIGLFTFVGYWNSYMTALIYLPTKQNIYGTLQLYLYNLIHIRDDLAAAEDPIKSLSRPNIQSATVILSIIPILMLYPFILKYFTKGLVVGSVKG